MASVSTILTIDIGSDTIKMAEFSYIPGGGNLVLEKFAFEPIFVGEEDPVAVFSRIYQYMIQANGFKSKDVRITLSGQVAFSKLSKLPELTGDDDAIAKVIEFEAKQTVPYAMDEIIWDYQLIQHELPKITEYDDARYEYEALFVAVKKDLVTNYTDVILESGKNVISVNISPVAMSNAFYACGQGVVDQCEMLLNIGGQSSSLVICQSGRVFVRSIPIAGDAITQQISKEFGIPFNEAEELKRKHGFVALGGAYEDPDSEVAATISKIARNVMTRLHGEISRSINVWRSQHNGDKPKRLFISGGGALIQYVTDFFEEKLHINVDYLNVFSVMTLGDKVDKEYLLDVAPMFVELAGMGLRSCYDTPVDINILPDTIKTQKEIQSKKIYFYASAITVVVSILIFLAGVTQLRQFDEERVAKVRDKVDAAKELSNKVKAENNKVTALKGDYDKFANVVKQRGQWVEIFNELQRITPDTMWFASIEGIPSIEDDIKQNEVKSSDDGMSGASASGRNPFGGGSGRPQMGGGMPGGMPPGMSGSDSSGAALEKPKDLTALKIQGYSLVLNQEILGDAVKENLKKSKLFKHEEVDDVVVKLIMQGVDKDNVIAFTLYLKLQKPIKMD